MSILIYNNNNKVQNTIFNNQSQINILVIKRYNSINKKLNLGNSTVKDLKLNKLNKSVYNKIINNLELNELMDKFMKNVCLSDNIKLKLKECLFKYEYCRKLKISHFPVDLNLINNKEFESHLIGFIEGDGCFRHGNKKQDKRFNPNLNIHLNIDDAHYLILILFFFNFNNKSLHYNDTLVSIDIGSKEDLDKLINILDTHIFLTKKNYDYNLFKEVVTLEQSRRLVYYKDASKKLEIYEEANKLANLMNNYENMENKLVSINDINKYINLDYILGFIEAEGLFGIIKSNDKFQVRLEITQASLNSNILHGIQNYLNNLPVDPNFSGSLSDYDKLYVEKKRGKTLDKSKLVMSNIDYHYFRIIPNFLNNTFYTKKYLDFII